MRRTRTTALLAVLGLGAAGLVPAAAAAPAPAAPPAAALHGGPGRALHAALAGLAPDAASAAAWRAALVEEASASAAAVSTEQELAFVYEVGDVDGDRRTDTAVLHPDRTVVRSGRDGRQLLRTDAAFVMGVPHAGRVRLLSYDFSFEETGGGYELTMLLRGLDARGRQVWEHAQVGTVSERGAGPAYVRQMDAVPSFFELDLRGAPSLVLGTLTATSVRQTSDSRAELVELSLADGAVSPLAAVEGRGRGYAWAGLVDAPEGTCYATVAPLGPVSQVGLACDGGAPEWEVAVPLRDPYVRADAGDFDGDGLDDLAVSTYGTRRAGVLRGTHVLSRADGSTLGTSALDDIVPTGGDADGDGVPDFLRFAEDVEGLGVQGVNLAGDVLYEAQLDVMGSTSAAIGLDVTGDGVGDAYLRTSPRRGEPVALVVDGRTGRTKRVEGVDGLVHPGLRRTGLDLVRATVESGRLRVRVLSGDLGRPLLDVRVPGAATATSFSSAGTADLDGDGRRDLLVASRARERRVTTAFSASVRLLWQTSETAPPVDEEHGVLIGYA